MFQRAPKADDTVVPILAFKKFDLSGRDKQLCHWTMPRQGMQAGASKMIHQLELQRKIGDNSLIEHAKPARPESMESAIHTHTQTHRVCVFVS